MNYRNFEKKAIGKNKIIRTQFKQKLKQNKCTFARKSQFNLNKLTLITEPTNRTPVYPATNTPLE